MSTLTQREIQVLHLTCLGFADKEMAYLMKVSERTVKTHLQRLRKKLKMKGNGRVQLVVYAIRTGLYCPWCDL